MSSKYSNAFEELQELFWAKAWFKGTTLKVNIFFWILLPDKILTTDNLLKREFNIVNRCYLYKEANELVNHLTIHCSYTIRLWEKVCVFLNITWVFPLTIQEFFNGWKSPSTNNLVMRLWDFLLPFI